MFYLSLNNNSLSCHPASDSDSDSGSDSDKANLKTPIPASVPIKLLPLHPCSTNLMIIFDLFNCHSGVCLINIPKTQFGVLFYLFLV